MAFSGKTQLVQQEIGNPSDAQSRFNDQQASDRVPLVLVPNNRWWCSCYYTVPSGVSCITQQFGKDCDAMEEGSDGRRIRGLAEPGLRCAPACRQIKYCVTRQSCTYEGVVKSCPTIDNVMVDCELTLVFQIGPEPNKVRNFVYKLGALRFNEFLAAATDEAMRQLVRGEYLENVLELRGSSQAGVRRVMNSLNAKFAAFGVTFLRAVIKDVKLGAVLENLLEKTTNFKTKIRDISKEHEVEMKKIDYDFNQRKTELEKDYDRRLQDIENDQTVALITRDKQKVEANSRMEVNITKATESQAVELQKANADFNVVTLQAQQWNEELIAKVKADCESQKIEAERDCKDRVVESQQLIQAAQDNAKALTLEAGAEGKAAAQLKVQREFKLAMAKYEVEEAMARRSKIVISGKNGDRLLESMLDTSILGNIKLSS